MPSEGVHEESGRGGREGITEEAGARDSGVDKERLSRSSYCSWGRGGICFIQINRKSHMFRHSRLRLRTFSSTYIVIKSTIAPFYSSTPVKWSLR